MRYDIFYNWLKLWNCEILPLHRKINKKNLWFLFCMRDFKHLLKDWLANFWSKSKSMFKGYKILIHRIKRTKRHIMKGCGLNLKILEGVWIHFQKLNWGKKSDLWKKSSKSHSNVPLWPKQPKMAIVAKWQIEGRYEFSFEPKKDSEQIVSYHEG